MEGGGGGGGRGCKKKLCKPPDLATFNFGVRTRLGQSGMSHCVDREQSCTLTEINEIFS